MKVVVTGGAGYIGSVVAAELLLEGHDVVVVDNLVRGHADAVPEGAEFVRADLLDLEVLSTVLARGVDAGRGEPALLQRRRVVAGTG